METLEKTWEQEETQEEQDIMEEAQALLDLQESPPEAEEEPLSEEPEDGYTQEETAVSRVYRPRIRAELVMGIIAACAAMLLIVMIVICMPYFKAEEEKPIMDEDPEALHEQLANAATEPAQDLILEPTTPETEPENPTIPPDPNPYDRFDFQYNRNNYLLLQNIRSYAGVDVSAYQGKIDWKTVKNSGISFAIIRLGYRGYGSGKLVEDTYARANLQGAREAGLKVGAYFFSQALNTREVNEEIAFMMEVLDGFLPDMPLVLDWEIPASDARTANMDGRTLTDIQLHYCKTITEKGYQPMIYFNWHQSETLYILSELEEYPFWLALYQDRMTYPWKVEMWQYTSKGKVPGIEGNVDLNVYMPD